MEEKMTELIIPLSRPIGRQLPITAETQPTPLEIQRWEDDGGAVPADAGQRIRSRCHCGADHRERAAA
jgi:hypothetical protein